MARSDACSTHGTSYWTIADEAIGSFESVTSQSADALCVLGDCAWDWTSNWTSELVAEAGVAQTVKNGWREERILGARGPRSVGRPLPA